MISKKGIQRTDWIARPSSRSDSRRDRSERNIRKLATYLRDSLHYKRPSRAAHQSYAQWRVRVCWRDLPGQRKYTVLLNLYEYIIDDIDVYYKGRCTFENLSALLELLREDERGYNRVRSQQTAFSRLPKNSTEPTRVWSTNAHWALDPTCSTPPKYSSLTRR